MTTEFDTSSSACSSEAFQDDPRRCSPSCASGAPCTTPTSPAPHYSLSREADVARGAARRRDVVVEVRARASPTARSAPGVLVSSDPPLHTTERLAISRAFKPSVIEAMEPDMRALVDELVDSFADRGEGDLSPTSAMPLPLIVMCWLLGMPGEDIDDVPLLGAADGRGGGDGGRTSGQRRGGRRLPRLLRLLRAATSTAGRRPSRPATTCRTTSSPGCSPSSATASGSPSSRSSASASSCSSPGRATTTLLIGNVVHRLLEHPEQLALRAPRPHARPQRRRGEPALRRAGARAVPHQHLPGRRSTASTSRSTRRCCMMFGSANRDPEAWDDPDRFDITRDLQGPEAPRRVRLRHPLLPRRAAGAAGGGGGPRRRARPAARPPARRRRRRG